MTKTTKTRKSEATSEYTCTEEEREKAALICAIAASNPDLAEMYDSVCEAIGIVQFDGNGKEFQGVSLAFLAWRVTQLDGFPFAHPDAEAEAMIRTGWSPTR